MSVNVLLLLFLMGGVIGVLAGLMGIGGGMIMVPFLVSAFSNEGYPAEALIKMAIGTSLATIMFTSISSVISHHKRGGVVWPMVLGLVPGIVVGALIGTQLVGVAPAPVVATAFCLFLLWSAWRMVKHRPPQAITPTNPEPGRRDLAVAGAGIGVVSAILGAGGGFMTIPYLIGHGVAPPRAIGSSAACGLPIALAGAVGYALAGRNAGLSGAVVGFIHVPALLAIAAASVMTAPMGVRLAHRLPIATLRMMLAGLLTLLAAYTAWKVI